MKKIKQYERAIEMAELRRNNHSLRQIGMRYNLTHERVRQILVLFFPKEKFEYYKLPPEERICPHCKCSFIVSPSIKKKFCARACRSAYVISKNGGIPSAHRKGATQEEKRAYWRYKAHAWNLKHRHTPEYKAKVKIANQKFKLKLKKDPKLRKKIRQYQYKRFKEKYHNDPIFREKFLEKQRTYQKQRREFWKRAMRCS